ncbi:MAG: tRNA (adenosine(37)-N6)-threonylcarbamoyltransferase complex dimerization subunit type 1 TsaB [Defluviitaleaceae bacterium]|nr:tRNA (adenosine(37)-N6)-threonylcarbamoyltransferase complex dimerization subunit type 1 TsaB [Defluviitaleaceae bacterium]
MHILAIDTSGTTSSAAIMDEYIILAESSVTLSDLRGAGRNGRKTHSETLMPMIDRLFEITGMTISEIDYIACTCGPGSFTGLRIGAATAKGLAFAADKPLVAVPTLDAMAYTVASLAAPGTWAVPMMDARRGQVYSAFYRVKEDFTLQRTTDYLAEAAEDLLEMLKGQISENDPVIFLGDGAKANQDRICLAGSSMAIPCNNYPRAACAGARALEMIGNGQYADESEFSLLYIRKPQAQRELEARQK